MMPGMVVLDTARATAPGVSSAMSIMCPFVASTKRATGLVGRVVIRSVAPATGPSVTLNIFCALTPVWTTGCPLFVVFVVSVTPVVVWVLPVPKEGAVFCAGAALGPLNNTNQTIKSAAIIPAPTIAAIHLILLFIILYKRNWWHLSRRQRSGRQSHRDCLYSYYRSLLFAAISLGSRDSLLED